MSEKAAIARVGLVFAIVFIVAIGGVIVLVNDGISTNPDNVESETVCTYQSTTSTMTYHVGTMPLCPASNETESTGFSSSSNYAISCSVLSQTGSSWNTTAVIAEESTTYTIYTAYTSSEYFVPCSSTSNNTNLTETTLTNAELCTSLVTDNGDVLCPAPISYSSFYQLIKDPNNSFTNYNNGTIVLNIGQAPYCTVWLYYLPNETSIIEYRGVTGSETCA